MFASLATLARSQLDPSFAQLRKKIDDNYVLASETLFSHVYGNSRYISESAVALSM